MRSRLAGCVVGVALPFCVAAPAHAIGFTVSPGDNAAVSETADSQAYVVTPTCTLDDVLGSSLNVPVSLENGSTANPATGGADFASTVPDPPGSVSCAVGGVPGSAKTFHVTILHDTLDEPQESVTVTVGNTTRTLLIDDDDDPAKVSIGDLAANEGTSAGGGTTSFEVPVTLNTASGFAISVHYAATEGTAKANDDFTPTSGTLSIPAGQTSGKVVVPVKAEALDEPDETLTVTISAFVSSDPGTKLTGTVTVKNDDVPQIILGGVGAAEGNTGTTTFSFPVVLTNPSTRTLTVRYKTFDIADPGVAEVNRAHAGSDYTAAAGTITFAPGETTKSFSVAVAPDAAVEADEIFGAQIFEPDPVLGLADAYKIGAGVALGLIKNDDGGTGTGSGGGTTTIPVTTPPGGTGTTATGAGGDTTEPNVKLSALKFRKPKRLTLSLTCPVTEKNCRTTLTVFSVANKKSKVKGLRKERKLGSKVFVVPGGQTATITINISAKNAALVKQGKRVKAKAYAVVRDDAGNVGTATVSGTLKG